MVAVHIQENTKKLVIQLAFQNVQVSVYGVVTCFSDEVDLLTSPNDATGGRARPQMGPLLDPVQFVYTKLSDH